METSTVSAQKRREILEALRRGTVPRRGLEVLAVMRELAEDGMTMIIVTHEITFAADVADRVIVMADGAIIEQGPPDAVIHNPRSPRTQQFFRAIVDRR